MAGEPKAVRGAARNAALRGALARGNSDIASRRREMVERRTALAKAAAEREAKAKFTPLKTENYDSLLSERRRDQLWRQNEKAGWGFSRATSVSQLKKYFDGDDTAKAGVQWRFEDANFHSLNRALDSGDARKVQAALNDIFDDQKPSKREKELFKRFGL